MDPFTISLIAGAGLGALKHGEDTKRAGKQRELAAETAKWSPWTGMTPEMPQEGSFWGSMLQGAGAGAMMGQGLKGQTPAATAGASTAAAPVQGANPYINPYDPKNMMIS